MQKVISFLIFFLSIFVDGCASVQTNHLNELKIKFPYGLIGNDYGILSEEDLAINTCNVTEVEPFPPKDISPYPYWQCYGVKDVAIVCDDSGFDEDEKSIMSILDLRVRSEEAAHDYFTRRAIRIDSCQYFQKELERLTKNEGQICVSGEFWKYSYEGGKQIGIWSFDKFKTARGCISYFDGDCELKVQLENGCQPLVGFPSQRMGSTKLWGDQRGSASGLLRSTRKSLQPGLSRCPAKLGSRSFRLSSPVECTKRFAFYSLYFFTPLKSKSPAYFRKRGFLILWGDQRGSNPRPPESQSGALPTELWPPCLQGFYVLFKILSTLSTLFI
jgi:hypothetical protein